MDQANTKLKSRKPQTEDQEKRLVTVKASKKYKVIVPKDEKLLDPSFEVPDTPLGRKAKAYVILDQACDEICADLREAGHELVAAFDEAQKKQMKVQVGRNVFTLERHHLAAKDEIKVKK